ncbi:hypothetical protein [Bradyrhizobium sp. USDA 4486]
MAVVEDAQVDNSWRVGNRFAWAAATPAAFALVYPLFVDGFHWAVGDPGTPQTVRGIAIAAVMLALMFAVPLYAFYRVFAVPMSPTVPLALEIRARRLAYAVVAAPTFYCFVGVSKFLFSIPLPDEATWAIIWASGIAWSVLASPGEVKRATSEPAATLRVAHGISALIVVVYVIFHLTNHLFAWGGEPAHAEVMEMGRKVYRSPIGEPILVAAMSFQVISGFVLAWKWSAFRGDFYRTFQLATGFYLSVYILGHLTAVFILARAFFGIPTGWGFATGAPNGLIHDAWAARLIPHYAIGVFVVIAHLFSGLRVVMIAHGAREAIASRVWLAGTLFSAALALVIMLAMCGMRLG